MMRASHRQPGFLAALVHRLAGIALAIFLPLHFLALSTALRGDAALEGFLRYTERPLFKVAEWGLVVLLAVHLAGGVRILMIEFAPWSGLRKDFIALTCGAGIVAGLAFALALVH